MWQHCFKASQGSLTIRTLGKGHECIPFVTAYLGCGADPSLNCVVCLSLSLSLTPSCSFHFLWLSVSPPHSNLRLSFISSSPFIFSLWSLHPPLPLLPSSNSCKPIIFPSMQLKAYPWALIHPVCLTQVWLWGAALGFWPFPGHLGPSWPPKTREPTWRPWRRPPQLNITEVQQIKSYWNYEPFTNWKSPFLSTNQILAFGLRTNQSCMYHLRLIVREVTNLSIVALRLSNY